MTYADLTSVRFSNTNIFQVHITTCQPTLSITQGETSSSITKTAIDPAVGGTIEYRYTADTDDPACPVVEVRALVATGDKTTVTPGITPGTGGASSMVVSDPSLVATYDFFIHAISKGGKWKTNTS